jgi:dipeptidyl aminopeptidase/acylaminoacyl peptidase
MKNWRTEMRKWKVAGCLYLCLALALVSLWGPSGVAQQQKPLTVENALKTLAFASFEPIALSPDGGLVAYTIADTSKHETVSDARYQSYTPTGAPTSAVGNSIWLTDLKTHVARNLTEGKGTNWGPVWSPNGKYLAFCSDRGGEAHLWVWERDTDALRQLSDAIVRPTDPSFVPRWTPDSEKILVKTLPAAMTLEQAADAAYGPAQKKEDTKKADNLGVTATVLKYDPADEQKKDENAPPKPAAPSIYYELARNVDLTLIDVKTARADHLVHAVRPIGQWYVISPDGKFFVYTDLIDQKAVTQEETYQLHLFDLATQSDRVLLKSPITVFSLGVSWAPDSRSIAYTIRHDQAPTTSAAAPREDCFLVALDQGEPQLLTPGDHPGFGDDHRAPLWDAKGKNLYFISSENYVRRGTSKVWKVSLPDRRFSVLAEIPDRIIREVVSPVSGGRFWSPDGGRSLVVSTREESTKREGFYKIDLESGRTSRLFEANMLVGDILGIDAAPGGKTFVFVGQDAQHPEDIWVTGADSHDPQRISSVNGNFEGVVFGKSQLIDYYSVDGELLHGALLLPSNYEQGKKYPLIVDPYGGSFRSNSVFRFGLSGTGAENLQLLATRGYAVLLPDTPIHTNSPMAEIAKTVIPAVDRVVELGIADPNRLGIMGHSYGGYSTLAILVQSTRFRAAVDSAGPSDLISFYGEMWDTGDATAIGWAETGQGKMGGTPWQYRDRYIENSPLFYLDRVKTPLLIVHGASDITVPNDQMSPTFVALRRLGKEVTYANYAGEGHWEGRWGAANVKDYWDRVIDWFDTHLQPAPSAQ